ncbi:methylenetetrahydrofolate reductase [Modestobacter sp. SYSU DS0290]
MNRSLPRSPDTRAALRRTFETLGYEVIPFKKTGDDVQEHVPTDVRLTVTASPAKGIGATVELAVRLTRAGYTVAPHLSAQQISDRAHLTDVIAQVREAGITEVFVVGGDPTDTPTEFRDAHALLLAMKEIGHPFTEVGIGGHPEGHPSVSDDVLFGALADKAPFANHITTQICFDTKRIQTWARELRRRGIDLPIHIGIPGAVTRQKLLRVSNGLGIGESAKFLKKQQNLLWRFFLPGGYSPDGIIRGLAPSIGASDQRIEKFHVFTFNDLAPTEAWRQQMLNRLAEH